MHLRWFVDEADTALTIELDDLASSTEYTVVFTTDLLLGGENIPQEWSWEFTTGTDREFSVPNSMDRPEFTMTDHFPTSLSYTISWDSVDGADSYELQETTSEIFTYVNQTWTPTDTSIVINQTYSNQYYYRVRAFNGTDYSE